MASIPIGMDSDKKSVDLILSMANRHGLITGATGTGKTVTLQRIAEQLSNVGVPVFTADVKGDLSGLALPGGNQPKILERVKTLKLKNYTPHGNPVVFWDMYGKSGHPLRTTISEMGPLLLGRLLNLNDTQQGVLNAAFSYADDQGLLLLDIKDIRALLDWMLKEAGTLNAQYGNIASATVGAIQRGLLTLDEAGGKYFFGEPAFKIEHLFQVDQSGHGVINILDATQLVSDGRLYSTFLLWLLSELFENLPEIGDQDKPKLVFFFDEAHLMFKTAPKTLIEKIEQLVRLIRSKGVGVYFVTQTPIDVPVTVLGQLGNRVQHALRAYTPKDQKSVKVAAETFRKNPKINTEKTIMELGVGEALVSFLDAEGTPSMVTEVKIYPPESRVGAITDDERKAIILQSPFYGVYETSTERESAYEMLQKRAEEKTPEVVTTERTGRPPGRPPQSATETFIKTTIRSASNQFGKQIIRGILGSIFGKK